MENKISKQFKFRGNVVRICNTNFAEMMKKAFKYGIRHADNDWDKPITLERHIVVNRFGVLISFNPIDLGHGYLKLTRKESEQFRTMYDSIN